MPKTPFLLPNACMAALVLLSVLMLGGCTTTKKAAEAADAAPRTTVPDSLRGTSAKGGATASNRRSEPSTTGPDETQQAALPSDVAAPTAEKAFPPAPEQPQQTSIAGLATQPTGIRADTGTIFSSEPPMPAAGLSTSGPVPADLPRRNFNAMTASVYSMPQPAPAATCGTDAQGNAISC